MTHICDLGPADDPAEEHRLALSEALGLGTGAPWDAVRERAAELAAAVSAVRPPATDRTALREQIADTLAEADGWRWVSDSDKARSSTYRSYQSRADAVLARLPEPADRAAVLLWAAEHLAARCPHLGKAEPLRTCTCAAADELLRLASQEPGAPDYASAREGMLRRLAAEPAAAGPDQTRPRCPDCQMPHDLTPGSLPVAMCQSVRRRVAEAEQLHAEGDHNLCRRADCDVIRKRYADAPAVGGAQQQTEARP